MVPLPGLATADPAANRCSLHHSVIPPNPLAESFSGSPHPWSCPFNLPGYLPWPSLCGQTSCLTSISVLEVSFALSLKHPLPRPEAASSFHPEMCPASSWYVYNPVNEARILRVSNPVWAPPYVFFLKTSISVRWINHIPFYSLLNPLCAYSAKHFWMFRENKYLNCMIKNKLDKKANDKKHSTNEDNPTPRVGYLAQIQQRYRKQQNNVTGNLSRTFVRIYWFFVWQVHYLYNKKCRNWRRLLQNNPQTGRKCTEEGQCASAHSPAQGPCGDVNFMYKNAIGYDVKKDRYSRQSMPHRECQPQRKSQRAASISLT